MITVTKHFQSGFSLSAEGDTIKEALGAFSEAAASEFLTEAKCGVCGCTDIFPNVRTVPDPTDKKGKSTFTYFEMKCGKPGCWASLDLAQKKDMTLYPRRKDKEGKPIGKNGWVKWVKKDEAGANE